MSKTGGGQLLVDTSSISFPTTPTNLPVPVSIAGGSITLGESVQATALNFDISPAASLVVGDDVVAGIRSLTGTGVREDLAGTTAARRHDKLDALRSQSQHGQFRRADRGHRPVRDGGPRPAHDRLDQLSGGRRNHGSRRLVEGEREHQRGLAAGQFGGDLRRAGDLVVFRACRVSVRLDVPGHNERNVTSEPVHTARRHEHDLRSRPPASSTLAAPINYSYVESDLFTVIQTPLVKNSFANVIGGQAVLGGVPFCGEHGAERRQTRPATVATSRRQLSSSGSPSFPGQLVTFTASVNTRTAAVSVWKQSASWSGGLVIATVPLASGAAVYTTSSLPLGTTTITAVYNGAMGNVGSTSRDFRAQTVNPYPTATTIGSSMNPAVLGQTVTLTAAVRNAAGPLALARSPSAVATCFWALLRLTPRVRPAYRSAHCRWAPRQFKRFTTDRRET